MPHQQSWVLICFPGTIRMILKIAWISWFGLASNHEYIRSLFNSLLGMGIVIELKGKKKKGVAMEIPQRKKVIVDKSHPVK